MRNNMNKLVIKLLVVLALFASFASNAQNYAKITYVHTQADGSVLAATNEEGGLEYHIDHYPFGDELRNTSTDRNNNLSFTGKPHDEEIGLSYYGARWYDPETGRFTGVDPIAADPDDYRTFNRYSYSFNNPYKYSDPDGRLPFLIPIAIFVAKEIAAEAASRATGGATDFLSFRRLGQKALTKGALEFKNFRKVNDGGNDIHRIGGGSADNLALSSREAKLDPPGISVLKGGSPSQAASQMRAAFPNGTDLIKKSDCVGSTCASKIRAAGFDVIPNPTNKFDNHHRIIHPDGAAGFNSENLKRLSNAFKDTTGNKSYASRSSFRKSDN